VSAPGRRFKIFYFAQQRYEFTGNLVLDARQDIGYWILDSESRQVRSLSVYRRVSSALYFNNLSLVKLGGTRRGKQTAYWMFTL